MYVAPRRLALRRFRPDDVEFVGWFSLYPVTPSEGAMNSWPDTGHDVAVLALGYRLRRSAWGQGLATEGSRLLLENAFADPRVSQVVATTMAVNTGSMRVMEKLGMRHRRTLHLDWAVPLPGNDLGDVEYAVTREDWHASNDADSSTEEIGRASGGEQT